MLATTNLSYTFYWQTITGQFPSLKRTDNLVDKLYASLATPTPEEAKERELTKMMGDDFMIIPLYNVYEMYVIQPNVNDTGYCQWSAGTIYTPEATWLGK